LRNGSFVSSPIILLKSNHNRTNSRYKVAFLMSETPRKREDNAIMITQTDSSSREDLSDNNNSPLRRSRDVERKISRKDLKKKKRKTKLEKYVAKAVFELQTEFDYEDLISVTYKKILRIFMRVTGSEFGYIAEVKPHNKEPEFLQVFYFLFSSHSKFPSLPLTMLYFDALWTELNIWI